MTLFCTSYVPDSLYRLLGSVCILAGGESGGKIHLAATSRSGIDFGNLPRRCMSCSLGMADRSLVFGFAVFPSILADQTGLELGALRTPRLLPLMICRARELCRSGRIV